MSSLKAGNRELKSFVEYVRSVLLSGKEDETSDYYQEVHKVLNTEGKGVVKTTLDESLVAVAVGGDVVLDVLYDNITAKSLRLTSDGFVSMDTTLTEGVSGLRKLMVSFGLGLNARSFMEELKYLRARRFMVHLKGSGGDMSDVGGFYVAKCIVEGAERYGFLGEVVHEKKTVDGYSESVLITSKYFEQKGVYKHDVLCRYVDGYLVHSKDGNTGDLYEIFIRYDRQKLEPWKYSSPNWTGWVNADVGIMQSIKDKCYHMDVTRNDIDSHLKELERKAGEGKNTYPKGSGDSEPIENSGYVVTKRSENVLGRGKEDVPSKSSFKRFMEELFFGKH